MAKKLKQAQFTHCKVVITSHPKAPWRVSYPVDENGVTRRKRRMFSTQQKALDFAAGHEKEVADHGVRFGSITAEARRAGFSRHVVAVLRAKRELCEEASGTDPFKGDVRKRAETILRKQGVSPFTGDDRWKEIFAAAGLSYLTQKRVPRSK